MKKTLVAVALLGAFAGSAFAADVNIYGRVDQGLRYIHVKGGDDTLQVTNNRSTPRVGINVKEKISENLTARLYLENGFKADTGKFGTANTLFDRRSILALETNFGEFAMGRMGTVQSTVAPFTMGLIKYDPFGTSYGDASIGSTFANSSRADNAFTYRSPKFAGFQFGATYSLNVDEETDTPDTDPLGDRNRAIALATTYTNDRMFLSLTFSQLNFSNQDGYEDARTYALGGTFNVTDTTKLFAGVQYQSDWRSAAGMKASSSSIYGLDGWSYLLGATQTFGPHKIIADVQYFDGEMSNDSSKDAKRTVLAAAYEYYFSKTLIGYCAATYSDVSGALGRDNENLDRYMLMIGLDKHF